MNTENTKDNFNNFEPATYNNNQVGLIPKESTTDAMGGTSNFQSERIQEKKKGSKCILITCIVLLVILILLIISVVALYFIVLDKSSKSDIPLPKIKNGACNNTADN